MPPQRHPTDSDLQEIMTRMRKTSGRSLYVLTAIALSVAVPAQAQFQPRPMSDPATGETYHIEGSAGFWNTSSQMSIASEGFGILGSTIDFKNDLGLESGSLKELFVTVRPGKKHKLVQGQLDIFGGECEPRADDEREDLDAA